MKAYCPKIKLLTCEPKSCPFWQIRVLCNSHFAFISTYCWRKLLCSFPSPLFSNHSIYMVTSLCCIPWMLESLLEFVGHTAFLGFLIPSKTRAGVGAESISYPRPLCQGPVSSHIGVGKMFCELELKNFGSVCVDFFNFCDILVPKV